MGMMYGSREKFSLKMPLAITWQTWLKRNLLKKIIIQWKISNSMEVKKSEKEVEDAEQFKWV